MVQKGCSCLLERQSGKYILSWSLMFEQLTCIARPIQLHNVPYLGLLSDTTCDSLRSYFMVTLESEWLKLMSCGDGSWVTPYPGRLGTGFAGSGMGWPVRPLGRPRRFTNCGQQLRDITVQQFSPYGARPRDLLGPPPGPSPRTPCTPPERHMQHLSKTNKHKTE